MIAKIRTLGQIVAAVVTLALVLLFLAGLALGVVGYAVDMVKGVLEDPGPFVGTACVVASVALAVVISRSVRVKRREKRIRGFLNAFDGLVHRDADGGMPFIVGIRLGESFSSTRDRVASLSAEQSEHHELNDVLRWNISPDSFEAPTQIGLQVWTHRDRIFEVRVFLPDCDDGAFETMKQHLVTLYGEPEEDDPTPLGFSGPRETKFGSEESAGTVSVQLFQRDPERELTANPFIDRGSAYLYVSFIHDDIWEEVHGYPPRASLIAEDDTDLDDEDDDRADTGRSEFHYYPPSDLCAVCSASEGLTSYPGPTGLAMLCAKHSALRAGPHVAELNRMLELVEQAEEAYCAGEEDLFAQLVQKIINVPDFEDCWMGRHLGLQPETKAAEEANDDRQP